MLCEMAEKKAILNLRLDPIVRDNFAIAAKLRGASMSGLIHQFIVRTIREEKEASPHEFRVHRIRTHNHKLAPVVARIEPGKPTKDDVRRMINSDEIAEAERRLKPRKRKTG